MKLKSMRSARESRALHCLRGCWGMLGANITKECLFTAGLQVALWRTFCTRCKNTSSVTFSEIPSQSALQYKPWKAKQTNERNFPSISIPRLTKSSTESLQGTNLGVHYYVYQTGASKAFGFFLKLAESCHSMCLETPFKHVCRCSEDLMLAVPA